jgi:hypothetical protein
VLQAIAMGDDFGSHDMYLCSGASM